MSPRRWIAALRRRGARTRVSRRRLAAVLASVLVVGAGAVEAQRRMMAEDEPNVPYDGRYTFARVRYEMSLGGFGRGGEPPWHHDYPRGERHFTKLLAELSTIRVRTTESNILSLTDKEIFKYPVLYMAEPGFWQPNDLEVLSLRAYLEKGGLLIFDDYTDRQAMNLYMQLQRVLPQSRVIDLDASHPVFDSFFRIENLNYAHPYYGGLSRFQAIFEDNDPSKRMLMLLNTNNDLSEYWEFSDIGMFPIEASNEAYKLGINYIVYALTR